MVGPGHQYFYIVFQMIHTYIQGGEPLFQSLNKVDYNHIPIRGKAVVTLVQVLNRGRDLLVASSHTWV